MSENSVTILKDRLTSFEEELKSSISNIHLVENYILEMAAKRRKWLSNISESEGFEKKWRQKRLDCIRRQIDIHRVEGRIETLRLNESLEILERTCSAGIVVNDATQSHRVNLEKARDSLLQSIEIHSKLNNFNSGLLQEVQSIRAEESHRNENRSNNIRNQLKMFAKRLNEYKKVTKANYSKIMNDYLILRHNVRVAKEALALRQNEVYATRSKLQENYEKLMQEINVQKTNKYHYIQKEVDLQLDTLRSDVLRNEEEVQSLRVKLESLTEARKRKHKHVRDSITLYKKKYVDLQSQRRNEVHLTTSELRRLRDLLSRVEMKVFEREQSNVLNGNIYRRPADNVQSIKDNDVFWDQSFTDVPIDDLHLLDEISQRLEDMRLSMDNM